MFNPKISGIFAGAGFLLSFLVGLLAGVGFPLVLIRALIFAGIFFALSGAGYGAIQLCLPDLFDKSPGEAPILGAQVDISVGEEEGAGDISLASGNDLREFLENPGNSSGETLDQAGEDVYTEEGLAEELQKPSKPALPEGLGVIEDAGSVDTLPDLDSISGAFNAGSIPVGGSGSAGLSPASSFDGGGQNKAVELDKNFSVKEMASAIQTILKREDKG
jgi:hypothetical protein